MLAIPHQLCEQCRTFSQHLPEIKAEDLLYRRYEDLEALARSADDGCHLCSLLNAEIDSFEEFIYRKTPCDGLLVTSTLKATNDDFCEKWFFNIGSRSDFYDRFEARPAQPGSPLQIGAAIKLAIRRLSDIQDFDCAQSFSAMTRDGYLSKMTSSTESVKLAASWLNECLTEHTACGAMPGVPHNIPSRLIRLDYSMISGTFIPRFRLCNSFGTNVRYLALSHCWGTERPICLTSANMESFYQNISFSELPASFQQAMCLTVDLSYEYLWIDSLCIIQDCESDWTAESQIMGDIYQNAVCRVAATSAKDCHGGLFSHQNPLASMPLAVPLDAQTFLFAFNKKQWDFGTVDRSRVKDENPLETRAWAFQESIMACRTLSFERGRITWSCNQQGHATDQWNLQILRYFDEASGDDNPSSRAASSFYHKFFRSGPQSCSSRKERRFFQMDWHGLLGEYSGRQSTYTKDRLAALTGVISVLQRNTGLTSVSGMWKELMLIEILWKPQSPSDVSNHDRRAPSWSWISIDSAVMYVFDWVWLIYREVLEDPVPGYPLEILEIDTRKISFSAALFPVVFVQEGNTDRGGTRTEEWEVQDLRDFNSMVFMDDNSKPTLDNFLLPLIRVTGHDQYNTADRYATTVIDLGIVLQSSESSNDNFKRVGTFYTEPSGRLPESDTGTRDMHTIIATRIFHLV